MINGFMYSTVTCDDATFKITANWNDKKKEYYGISIVFDEKGKDIFWDNDDFIFGKFYNILQKYKFNILTDEDKYEIAEIYELLNNDIVLDLIECLDYAKEKFNYKL